MLPERLSEVGRSVPFFVSVFVAANTVLSARMELVAMTPLARNMVSTTISAPAVTAEIRGGTMRFNQRKIVRVIRPQPCPMSISMAKTRIATSGTTMYTLQPSGSTSTISRTSFCHIRKRRSMTMEPTAAMTPSGPHQSQLWLRSLILRFSFDSMNQNSQDAATPSM